MLYVPSDWVYMHSLCICATYGLYMCCLHVLTCSDGDSKDYFSTILQRVWKTQLDSNPDWISVSPLVVVEYRSLCTFVVSKLSNFYMV